MRNWVLHRKSSKIRRIRVQGGGGRPPQEYFYTLTQKKDAIVRPSTPFFVQFPLFPVPLLIPSLQKITIEYWIIHIPDFRCPSISLCDCQDVSMVFWLPTVLALLYNYLVPLNICQCFFLDHKKCYYFLSGDIFTWNRISRSFAKFNFNGILTKKLDKTTLMYSLFNL